MRVAFAALLALPALFAAAPPAAAASSNTLTVKAGEYTYKLSGSPKAGWVTINFVNAGVEYHVMAVAMLKKGVEPRDVLRALGEVFRAHGYEGASLTLITEATGLGKGSLYHLFPGGKEQMAAEVLADIDAWFELNIYAPLRETSDPARGIAAMIAGVDQYFHSGDRVCLVGLVALGAARDTFAEAVDGYFARWQVALASLLRRSGLSKGQAQRRAEDALLTIQGALVLARARNDAGIFRRALSDLTARLLAGVSP